MGFLKTLFGREKDPIEEQWAQERRIAYKSSLQESRLKEAKKLAGGIASLEREQKLEEYKKPKQNIFTSLRTVFDSPVQKRPSKKELKILKKYGSQQVQQTAQPQQYKDAGVTFFSSGRDRKPFKIFDY